MKKLKGALIATFAVTLSLGLAACGGKTDGPGPGPGPDDDYKIRMMNLSEEAFTLTDAQTSEEAWKSEVLDKISALVYYTGNAGRDTLKADKLTIDKSEVQLGTVGVYSATVTPVEHNADNISASIEISVVHDIVDGVCTVDGATETKEELNVDLTYKAFHTGEHTLSANGSSAIRPFGSVVVDGKEEEVKTHTVGRLEKGMKITVKGTAITTYVSEGAEEEYWYFPIIGFADTSVGEYTGGVGTSVIVRDEGWVLLDGIGTPRLLAAKAGNGAGGAIEEGNYGSHPSETGAIPLPGYKDHGEGTPTLEQWKDWYTYSTGDTTDTMTYVTQQDIELSWEYRNDGIVELTYNVTTDPSNPLKLVARTKVPDSPKGYYDTILHGEYVKMHFTEIVTLQTRTLESVNYNGFNSGAKTVYLENEMFDLGSLNVTITTKQDPNPAADTQFDVEANIGTANAPVWVPLSTTPLSDNMIGFRLIRTMGNVTKTAEIPADFIAIKKNAVDSAYAHTVVIDGVSFANNSQLGQLAFSSLSDASNTYAVLTVTGAANSLSEAQKAKLAGATANKYIAFRIWARDAANTKFTNGAQVTVKSGDAAVAGAYVNVTADYADVVLPVDAAIAAAGVTLSGLTEGGVDVRLVFESFDCLSVTSQVTYESLSLDKGGAVTIVYDFGVEGLAAVKANIGSVRLYANRSNIRFNQMENEGNVYRTGENKLGNIDVVATVDDAAGTITIVYNLPKFSVANVEKFDISLFAGSGSSAARQAIDTVYYDMNFAGDGSIGQAVGDNIYVEADGTTLYVAIATRADNVLSENVKRETINLNINNGTKEGLHFVNLGYRYVKGEFSFYSVLPEGAVEPTLTVFGTLDNALDTDYGHIVVLKVDTTKFGVSAAPFYFELNAQSETPAYILRANEGKVERKTLDAASLGGIELISEANCQQTGYASYPYSENGTVVFYAGLAEIGGAHRFEGDTCTLCGSARESKVLENTVTLRDNDFVQLKGVYNGDLHKEIYNGVTIQIKAGEHWYWLRSDAYIAKDSYGANIDAPEIFHSYDDPEQPSNFDLRTPVGKPNGVDGEEITESSFKEAMRNATFEYYLSYADGVVTMVHSLYAAGESKSPYITYTIKIKDVQRSAVTVAFGLDAAKVTGNAEYITGKVANDMTEEIGGDGFEAKGVNWTVGAEYTVGAVENGMLPVTGEGKAVALDEAHKSALGADAKNTHYIAFAVKFEKALASDVFVRVKANGAAVSGAVAIVEGDLLKVVIPTDGAVTEYVLDFASVSANTEQCDIRLDLSGVVASETVSAVTGSANLITGGEITITYTDVAISDDMLLDVNGVSFKKSELTAGKDFGNGVSVKSVSAEGTALTVVFTVAAPDLTGELTAYTIALKNANGVIQAQDVVDYLSLPETAVAGDARISQTVYAKANGSKLTLILAGVPEGTTELSLNANNGAAIGNENLALIQTYDLTFTVSIDGVVFASNNLYTSHTTAYRSKVGNAYAVMLEIDLSEMKIGENTEYSFEALPALSAGNTVIYTVGADRKISDGASVVLGERADIIAAGCTSIGVAAESYDGGKFYYNIQVTPSHTWGAANANGVQVCSVCGAIMKGGFATAEAIGPIAKIDDKSIVDEGLTVSFLASGATGDWASQALVTAEGNMILTLPNLDPWNNGVAGLANATAREKELAQKVKGANCFPAADNLMNGHTWDSYLNKTAYATITISKTAGIRYYVNGVLAVQYPIDKVVGQGTVADVAELVLLLAERTGIVAAKSGVQAEDLLVQRGALTEEQAAERYALYEAEKAVLPDNVAPEHPEYSAQQTASPENPIVVGKPDLSQGYTDNAWVSYINKGEKLVFTGTQKTLATAAVNDACTGAGLFSGIAVSAYFRADNWVNGGTESGGVHTIPSENWSIAKAYTCGGYESEKDNPWETNLAMFKKGGEIVITVDWSDVKKIVVSFRYTETVTEGEARVWTDTFTVTSTLRCGEFAKNIYTVTLGCVNSSASITSFVRTPAAN